MLAVGNAFKSCKAHHATISQLSTVFKFDTRVFVESQKQVLRDRCSGLDPTSRLHLLATLPSDDAQANYHRYKTLMSFPSVVKHIDSIEETIVVSGVWWCSTR
eukprot:Platyproteum_vivax@DN10945_c0_g1_i1.p1